MIHFLKKAFRKLRNELNNISEKLLIYVKDLRNKLKYGKNAPLYYERIWVDPMKIKRMIPRDEVKRVTGIHRNRASGVIVNWDDIEHSYPITEEFRIQYCFDHWKDGKSWEELGVIDHMSRTKKYGSWPIAKIKKRFRMLDEAYQETKKLGRLKTRREIDPSNFREQHGILVHIGKNGEPVFGGNGFHRLAIAQVLKLDEIPACVGMVAKSSIHQLKEYRR